MALSAFISLRVYWELILYFIEVESQEVIGYPFYSRRLRTLLRLWATCYLETEERKAQSLRYGSVF